MMKQRKEGLTARDKPTGWQRYNPMESAVCWQHVASRFTPDPLPQMTLTALLLLLCLLLGNHLLSLCLCQSAFLLDPLSIAILTR